jgi:membrane-associated phospholipid phosphatase
MLASSPALIQVWQFFTFLGNEEFFLLLPPLVYWCVSARRGIQLGVLIVGGDAFNLLFKLFLTSPRPYWFGEPIRALGKDVSFGMPSSHAQNGLAVWLLLAIVAAPRYGRGRCFTGAAIVILLIALSRVVLGMHFPSDIFGGWALGGVWLWVNLKYWDKFETFFRRRKVVEQVLASGVVVSVFVCLAVVLNAVRLDAEPYPGVKSSIFTHSAAYSTTIQAIFMRAGALFGLLVGIAHQSRRVRWLPVGPTIQKALRLLVGLIGVLAIWLGLARVMPTGIESYSLGLRFVRYGLLTSWIVWFAPLVFRRFRLGAASLRRASSASSLLDAELLLL